MTLEEFVALVTVENWIDRRPAVVAIFEPYRTQIEKATATVGPDDPRAQLFAKRLLARVHDADSDLHRRIIAAAGGGNIT